LSEWGPGTRSVWGGEEETGRPGRAGGVPPRGRPTQVPIVRSVAFGYDDTEGWLDAALGKVPGHIYSRNTNPTVAVFEEKVRLLEGAEAATAFASGMAAISGTLLTLLSPGDRVVSIRDSYGGTSKLFMDILPRFGIDATLIETTDHDAIESAIADVSPKVLYLETPTNPTLKVVDIARLARAGHAAGATVIVDNTFATPINQLPLELGADLVVHSATKVLGGHADALGGVTCGSSDLVKRVFGFREITGAAMDPDAAYLFVRGMKTLHLRVREQNSNAQKIAEWLHADPRVEAVFYPGLPSHEGHDIARAQMRGFGGILSFAPTGDWPAVEKLLAKLRLAHRAANLGSVETIAGPPATTSHVECTPEQRAELGIPESLVRYSVGIEDADDLIGDLDQALG
jgi:cystathionine gamma-synthase